MNMNNNSPSDFQYDEFVVDDSMIRSVMFDDRVSPSVPNAEPIASHEHYPNRDAEFLNGLQEVDEAIKEYGNMMITEILTPFDFGFDYEKGDKENRNRLEEAMNKLEKVFAEDIVVPGSPLEECKRCNDGVRIKAYWADPEYDERGRRMEIHILVHVCKHTFPNYDVPQIIVLCMKRGGDIFQYLDIMKQIKSKIE